VRNLPDGPEKTEKMAAWFDKDLGEWLVKLEGALPPATHDDSQKQWHLSERPPCRTLARVPGSDRRAMSPLLQLPRPCAAKTTHPNDAKCRG